MTALPEYATVDHVLAATQAVADHHDAIDAAHVAAIDHVANQPAEMDQGYDVDQGDLER